MRVKTPPIAAAFVLLVAVNVQAQASLDAARELYASAEYESALAMLDGLRASEWPREEQHAIELYRALCMVATGKEADAKNVIEGLVTRDPLYRPSNDLPPRVRTTYSETRKRMLPMAAQSAYHEAKAAFDFKDYAAAQRGFALVLAVLDDPDVQPQAARSPLSDIRTLATGFHELSAKAAAPPEPVAKALPPTPIALAGRASIRAAFMPVESGALYFVATGDPDGSHVFSRTLEEHNAAVARYVERQRSSQ